MHIVPHSQVSKIIIKLSKKSGHTRVARLLVVWHELGQLPRECAYIGLRNPAISDTYLSLTDSPFASISRIASSTLGVKLYIRAWRKTSWWCQISPSRVKMRNAMHCIQFFEKNAVVLQLRKSWNMMMFQNIPKNQKGTENISKHSEHQNYIYFIQ